MHKRIFDGLPTKEDKYCAIQYSAIEGVATAYFTNKKNATRFIKRKLQAGPVPMPLKCGTRTQWIVKYNPHNYMGTCSGINNNTFGD